MADAKVIVRLRIDSEALSIEEVTAALGIAPTRSWRKGDKRPGTSIIESHGVWIHEQSYEGAEQLESHVQMFLARLRNHDERIARLTEGNLGILSIVVYAASPPPLFFEKAVISNIHRMGLALDIDLYV